MIFAIKQNLSSYSRLDIYSLAKYLNIKHDSFQDSFQDLLWLLAITIYNNSIQTAKMSTSIIKFISDYYPILISSPNIKKDELFPTFNSIFIDKLKETIQFQQDFKKIMKNMSNEQKQEYDSKLRGMEEELKTFPDWNKLIILKDLLLIPGVDTKWIVNSYKNGSIRLLEDINSRLKPAIKDFNWLKKNGHVEKTIKIEKFNGLIGLEDFLDKYADKLVELHKNEQKLLNVKQDVNIIEKSNFTIYIPLTEEASKYYGQGTKWCTAANKECQFNKYNSKGNLYIIVPKKPTYIGEKYQLHVEENTFMNEKDEPVKLLLLAEKYPELATIEKINDKINKEILKQEFKVAIKEKNYNKIAKLLQQGYKLPTSKYTMTYKHIKNYIKDKQLRDVLLKYGDQHLINSINELVLKKKFKKSLEQENYEKMGKLLQKGATVSPFLISKIKDNDKLLNVLLQYGSQDVINNILEKGIQLGNLDIIKKAIDKGANLNVQPGQVSLLYKAVNPTRPINLNYQILELLLNNGANASENYSGILKNFLLTLDMAELLLKHGADPNASPPGSNSSALNSAVINDRIQFVKLYLKYGGKITNETLKNAKSYEMIDLLNKNKK